MFIEKLVPPFELCKQIPKGAFAGSVLEWNTHGKTDGTAELQVKSSDNRRLGAYYPAPTLEEILNDLNYRGWHPYCGVDCNGVYYCRVIDHQCSGATFIEAAMKLWLKVR